LERFDVAAIERQDVERVVARHDVAISIVAVGNYVVVGLPVKKSERCGS